jgi:hypothetical protein
LRAALTAAALGISAALAHAQTDGCAVLKLADAAALLGNGTTAKAAGAGCTWTSADGKRKLIVNRPGGAGLPGALMFAGSRTEAGKGSAKVSDEAGIGDRAFAVLETFGVVLTILKQDRLLQIQYFGNAAGTAKDLDALRPVAKAAAAAL